MFSRLGEGKFLEYNMKKKALTMKKKVFKLDPSSK